MATASNQQPVPGPSKGKGRAFLDGVSNMAGQIIKIAGAMSILAAGAAPFLPVLLTPVRKALRIDEWIAAAETQSVALTSAVHRMEELERRIAALEPVQTIGIYDIPASRVQGLCAAGTWCEYSYRVRRDPAFAHCGTPDKLEAWLYSYGESDPFPAKLDATPVRVGLGFVTLHGKFFNPPDMPPGPSGFELVVPYPGCDTTRPAVITYETTPRLEFDSQIGPNE